MEKRFRIELFGRVRVSVDGREIDRFTTQKSAALLVLLALANGRPVTRTELARRLWPGIDSDSGRVSLRTALSTLRRAIGDADSPEPLILADRFSVRLDTRQCTVDLLEFQGLLTRTSVEQADPDGDLRAAISLYTGELAAGVEDECLAGDRGRARDGFARAAGRLVNLLIQRGDLEEAADACSRALILAPGTIELDSLAAQLETIRPKPALAGFIPSSRPDSTVPSVPESARERPAAARPAPYFMAAAVVLPAIAAAAVFAGMRLLNNQPRRSQADPVLTGSVTAANSPVPVPTAPKRKAPAEQSRVPAPALPQPSRPAEPAGAPRLPPADRVWYAPVEVALPGGGDSELLAIDNGQRCVGYGKDGDGIRHPMNWDLGEAVPFNIAEDRPGTVAAAIGGDNTIVFNYSRPGERVDGTLFWTDGSKRDWPQPAPSEWGEVNIYGAAVTRDGQILGHFSSSTIAPTPMVVRGREVIKLGETGQPARVTAVNDGLTAVGTSGIGTRHTGAVSWQIPRRDEPYVAPRPVDLPTPSQGSSEARGINFHGVIVGNWSSDERPRACKWEKGQFALLPSERGTLSSTAAAINRHGVIVGSADLGAGNRAVVWRDGQLQDLNEVVPDRNGWTLTESRGINDNGWVIATGVKGERLRGFILIPVEQSLLTVTPSTILVSQPARGAAAVVLPAPATEPRQVRLHSSGSAVDPNVDSLVIPRGRRSAVFFYSVDDVTEHVSNTLTAKSGDLTAGATVHLRP